MIVFSINRLVGLHQITQSVSSKYNILAHTQHIIQKQ